MKISHIPNYFKVSHLVKQPYYNSKGFVTSYIKPYSPLIIHSYPSDNQLRGGGCGATKKEKSDTERLLETMKVPKNFLTNFQHHTSVIIDKAQLIMNDQYSNNEVQISIQWFHYNNEYLNIICQNKNYVKQANELFQNKFEELLRIFPSYLRGQCFLCYRIIQIANEILRILYSNQIYNEKREMEVTKQQLFLQYIGEFKNQIEIESAHIWKTEIEYEITLIEIMLMNCNTNSQEGNLLLTSFITNLVQSAIAMSPTDDLISSMIDGAKYLLKAGYEKVKYPIEVYETYYFFQSLKWQIIAAIKSNFSVLSQVEQLASGYKSQIAESNNWIVHYCWVQMICDLLSYRVVLNKQMFSNDSDLAKQQESWSCLLQKKIIKSLPYDSNEAVLQLYSDQQTLNSLNWNLLQIIYNQGKVQQFQIFNEDLMQEKFQENEDFWEIYSNFKFRKPVNQKRSGDSTILFYKQGLEALKLLLDRVEGFQNQIKIFNAQIQDQKKKLIQSQNSFQVNLDKNDLNFTIQKQQDGIIQLLYTLQIINYYINIEFFLLSLIQKSAKLDFEQTIFSAIEIFVNQESKLVITNVIQKLKDVQIYCIKLELETLRQESKDKLQSIQNDFDETFLEQIIVKLKGFIVNNQNFRNMIKHFFQKENKQISEELLSQATLLEIPSKLTSQVLFKKYLKEIENEELDSHFDLVALQFQIKQTILTSKVFIQLLKFELNNYISIEEKINGEIQLFDQQHNQKSQQELDQLKNLIKDTLNNLKNDIQSDELQQENQFPSLIDEISKCLIQKFDLIECIPINQDNQGLKKLAQTLISNLQYKVIMFYSEPTEIQAYKDQITEQIEKDLNQWVVAFNQEISSNQNYQPKYNNSNEKILLTLQNTEEVLSALSKKLQNLQTSIKIFKVASGFDQNDEYKQKNYQKLWIQLKTQLTGQIKLLSAEFMAIQNQQSINENNLPHNNLQIDQGNQIQIEIKSQDIQPKKNYFKLQNILFILDSVSQFQVNQNINLDYKYTEIIESLLQSQPVERSIFQFGNDYKVRECFIKQIKEMWVLERDESVRSLLKHKGLLEMQRRLFSSDLKSLTGQIKQEMEERLEKMKTLEQEIIMEGNEQQRCILQNYLNLRYEEMDSYIENISDMSAQMNISLLFLKEISKDVKQIKNKIDALQETVNKVADDVRKLRGKKYDELLMIRKLKVLQQSKITELDSVYIPLRTIEYDSKGVKVENQNNEKVYSVLLVENYQDVKAKENFEGEVNEFLWDDSMIKDVLLLKGPAGSGKSRAARKIEEFLWKLHSVQSLWIPIYVSLPSLKNPKYNLFEQAMESEYYNFDQQQIREFKEAIQKKQVQVVFILDSYDEMKQNCIQSNLISTNKLIQDFSINEPGKYIKFIITTRDEILNFIGYRSWFFGTNLGLLKEVELKSFDSDQIEDYIKNYVELCVKRKIRNLYEFITQVQGKAFDLEEFQIIWLSIFDVVTKCNQQVGENNFQSFFKNKEEEIIIERIKQIQNFKNLKKEQIITLRKDLQSVWSCSMFQKSIKNINIESLLSNPFMLEIVVQVLPDMIKQQTGSAKFKQQFTYALEKLLFQTMQSKFLIQKFAQQIKNNQVQIKFDYNNAINSLEINKIVDNMESQKFFQNYSLIDKIIVENQAIILEGKSSYLLGDQVKLVSAALKMKQFTVYEFYDGFINYYHDQQVQKLRQLGKIANLDVFQFSQSLALDLTTNQQTQVSYKQKGKLKLNFQNQSQNSLKAWEDQYFNDQDENHDYKKLIRSCVLLTIKGTSFSFVHKSIQEFFVAKYIIEQLESIKVKPNLEIFEEDQQLLKYSLYNQNKFNISKENFIGAIKFLKEILETMQQKIDEKLIEIVKLSKDKQFVCSASNSIFLLSRRQTDLGGIDFNSIKLSDTNLFGLSFFGTNLEGSSFQNVVIDSCNFNYCNLSNTNWNQIICKEKPYMEGHKDAILVVTFSNDGKLLATGGSDKLVIIWDVNTYKEIIQITQNQDDVTCVNFYQNNERLAKAGKDQLIYIFNIESLPEYQLMNCLREHENPIVKILFSQNETKMYSVDSIGYVIIWNTDKICEDHNFLIGDEKSQLKDLVLSSTGEFIFAIDTVLKRISCYSVKTQTCINFIEIGDFQPKKLVLSQNDAYLATFQDRNNSLIIWDVSINTQIKLIYFEENIQEINDLQFSPDSQFLSTLGNDIVLNRNLCKLGEIEQDVQYENCDCIAFSQVENLYFVYLKDIIYLVDLLTHQIMNTIKTDKEVLTIRFSQLSNQIATGNKDNSICIWDMYSFKLKFILQDYFKNQVKLRLSDDMKFSLRTDSQHIIVSDIQQVALYQNQNRQNIELESFTSFAFNQIGYILALGCYCYIKFIDLEDPQKLNEKVNFDSEIRCLSYSQDCSFLLIGLNNGQIFLQNNSNLNLELFTQLNNDNILSLSLSNNNLYLCAETQQNCQVWNINNKEKLIYKNDIQNTIKAAFSYINQIVAICTQNKIILFDCLEQKEICPDNYQVDKIVDITFSPFENCLVIIESSQIILYNLRTEKVAKISLLETEQLKFINFISHDILLTTSQNILRIWKISDKQVLGLQSSKFVKDVKAISVMSHTLSIGVIQNNHLAVYKIDEFYDRHVIAFSENEICFDISADWKFLAYNIQKQIYIMGLGEIKNQWQFQNSNSISALAFSYENKLLAMCGDENLLCLVNIETKQIDGKFNFKEKIKYLYFSSDNTKLFCVGKNLYIIDKIKSQEIQLAQMLLLMQENTLSNIHFQEITQYCQRKDKENTVLLKIKPNQFLIKKLNSDSFKSNFLVTQGCFSNIQYTKNNFLILSNQNMLVKKNLKEQQISNSFQFKFAFAISPNEKILVSEQDSCTIKCFDFSNGKEISSYQRKMSRRSNCIVFSGEESFLSASKEEICIYQMQEVKLSLLGRLKVTDLSFIYTNLSQKYFTINYKNRIKFYQLEKLNQLNYLFERQKCACLNMIMVQNEKALFLTFTQLFLYCDLEQYISKSRGYKGYDTIKEIIAYNQHVLLFGQGEVIRSILIDDLFGKNISPDLIGSTDQYGLRSLAYSKENSILASAGEDQRITLWDIEKKEQLTTFQGHSESINSISFSPDGKLIASGGEDKLTRLWNINPTQGMQSQEGHSAYIMGLEFSPDGTLLATSGADCIIRIWSIQNKKCLSVLRDHTIFIGQLKFSNDQTCLLSGDNDGNIILWDIRNLNEIKTRIINYIKLPIVSLFFIKNDLEFISLQNSWSCMEVGKNSQECTFELSNQVEYFKVISQRTIAYFQKENGIKIYDLRLKRDLFLKQQPKEQKLMFFTVYENFIVTIDRQFIVQFWREEEDSSEWAIQKKIDFSCYYHESELLFFEILTQQKLLVILSDFGFSCYDIASNNKYQKEDEIDLQLKEISCYQISQDEREIAVGHKVQLNQTTNKFQYLVSLYEMATFELIKFYQASDEEIISISFSFNNVYLAASNTKKCYLWNKATGQQVGDPFDVTDTYSKNTKIHFLENNFENIIIILKEEIYNGKQLSINKVIKRWNINNLSQSRINLHSTNISEIHITYLGTYLVYILQQTKDIYFSKLDYNNPNFDQQRLNISAVECVSSDRKEQYIFVLTKQDGLFVWDIINQQIKCQFRKTFFSNSNLMNCSLEGKKIVIIGKKTMISLFDFSNNQNSIKYEGHFYSQLEIKQFDIINDENILALAQNKLYFLKNKNFQLLEREFWEEGIQVQPCMPLLLKNGALFIKSAENCLCQYDIYQKIKVLELNDFHERKLFQSYDETFFIVTEKEKISFCKVEELQKHREQYQIKAHNAIIIDVAISSNSNIIATRCEELFTKIWCASNWEKPNLKAIFSDRQKQPNLRINFSFDSSLLFRNYQSKIIQIQVENCIQKNIQQHFDSNIEAIQKFIDKDQKEVILMNNGQELFISSELQEKKVIFQIPEKNSIIQFSNDYGLVAVSTDAIINVFQSQDWNQDISKSKSLIGHTDHVRSLSFSLDGKFLLSGGRDCTIRIWCLKSYNQLAILKNLSDSIKTVAFSPDSLHLAAGIYDGNVGLFIQNISQESLASKQNKLVKCLGQEYQIGCIKIFSQQSQLQAQKCKFINVNIDDQSIRKLFAQKI